GTPVLAEAAVGPQRAARAAEHRPDRKPWLHPHDQLGCAQAVANGEARVPGGIPRLMSRFVNRLGWVIVTAVLVSAFWIFYFGIAGSPTDEREVTASGEKITVDPKAQPPV